jgi:hypothetical protein
MGRVVCAGGVGTMTCQTCSGEGQVRSFGRFHIGQRVETEYGAGVVAELSARRVFVQLDDGQSLNVATGTFGYERIHALAECPVCDGAVCDECSVHYAEAGSAALFVLFAVLAVPFVWFAALLAGSLASL